MSTAVDKARTVADALAEIASWRADEVSRKKAELVEVDQEIANLRTALDNLQQQLEALEKFRSELESRDGTVDRKEIERSYAAIFGVLEGQALKVAERAVRATDADQERLEELLTSIASSEQAPLFEEYRQFKSTVEPTLAALPESYRSVVVQHHEQLAAKLREHVAGLFAEPVALDLPTLEVELVYGVDAPEGEPELLIVVLPVADEVHGSWVERQEDLQTHIAARTIQAIYQAVAEAGPAGAQAMCGGHQGLLAIEVDLVGATGDVGAAIAKHLEAVLGAASELAAAKVELRLREVSVDYLLPPEDEDEAQVTEVTHA